MENQNTNDQIKFYLTEMFALSRATGKLEKFDGKMITAHSLQQATEVLLTNELHHLQLTGEWFYTAEEAIAYLQGIDVEKEEPTSYKEIIQAMSYDKFMDWLDTLSKEEIYGARDEMLQIEGLDEHIKMINTYIKQHYEENKTQSSEDDQEEAGGEL